MLSWIDFRDFFEINIGLYGDTSMSPDQIHSLGLLIATLSPQTPVDTRAEPARPA
jgi:hypothetical protein